MSDTWKFTNVGMLDANIHTSRHSDYNVAPGTMYKIQGRGMEGMVTIALLLFTWIVIHVTDWEMAIIMLKRFPIIGVFWCFPFGYRKYLSFFSFFSLGAFYPSILIRFPILKFASFILFYLWGLGNKMGHGVDLKGCLSPV